MELNVGIFGITGMVGKELLKVLFDRNFAVKELSVYASERSVGKKIETPLGTKTVTNADSADFSKHNQHVLKMCLNTFETIFIYHCSFVDVPFRFPFFFMFSNVSNYFPFFFKFSKKCSMYFVLLFSFGFRV